MLESSSIYEDLLQSYLTLQRMDAANVLLLHSPTPALTNGTGHSQMQPKAQVHANRDQLSQNDGECNNIENVIVVRTSPQVITNPLPHRSPSFRGFQQLSPSTTGLFAPPQENSPAAIPVREISSPGQIASKSTLSRPATSNTFLASLRNREGHLSPPGSFGPPAMSPRGSGGKRKRSSAEPTLQIPRKLSFQSAKDESISDAIVFTRADSAEEKSDEDEIGNLGKKRRIKGIMKAPAPTVALPSPSVERAELLFDMDRLSIDNDTGDEQEKDKSGNLGEETGVATEELGEETPDATIPEEHDEDYSMEGADVRASRPIKPLPSRRRLRSPPPPQITTEEDEDNEDDDGEKNNVQNSPLASKDYIPPPLPSSSIIPGADEEDDEEDLRTGTKGIFYYKPTQAEKWARSQKRKQQIREYKARESRDEREKRRMRRRGSSSSRSGSGGGIGGISGIGGKLAAVARKVRFS